MSWVLFEALASLFFSEKPEGGSRVVTQKGRYMHKIRVGVTQAPCGPQASPG